MSFIYVDCKLKQGSATKPCCAEFKNESGAVAFFAYACTARLTKMLGANVYYASNATIPIDDFNYRSTCIIMLFSNSYTFVLKIPFVKKTVNYSELENAVKTYMSINGETIKSTKPIKFTTN